MSNLKLTVCIPVIVGPVNPNDWLWKLFRWCKKLGELIVSETMWKKNQSMFNWELEYEANYTLKFDIFFEFQQNKQRIG
jgi:hypothetical protein